MTPEQISAVLTKASYNRDVQAIANALRHNVPIFEQEFPTMSPLEIGTGLLVGISTYLDARGVPDQDVACLMQMMSEALGQIARRKAAVP